MTVFDIATAQRADTGRAIRLALRSRVPMCIVRSPHGDLYWYPPDPKRPVLTSEQYDNGWRHILTIKPKVRR